MFKNEKSETSTKIQVNIRVQYQNFDHFCAFSHITQILYQLKLNIIDKKNHVFSEQTSGWQGKKSGKCVGASTFILSIKTIFKENLGQERERR